MGTNIHPLSTSLTWLTGVARPWTLLFKYLDSTSVFCLCQKQANYARGLRQGQKEDAHLLILSALVSNNVFIDEMSVYSKHWGKASREPFYCWQVPYIYLWNSDIWNEMKNNYKILTLFPYLWLTLKKFVYSYSLAQSIKSFKLTSNLFIGVIQSTEWCWKMLYYHYEVFWTLIGWDLVSFWVRPNPQLSTVSWVKT